MAIKSKGFLRAGEAEAMLGNHFCTQAGLKRTLWHTEAVMHPKALPRVILGGVTKVFHTYLSLPTHVRPTPEHWAQPFFLALHSNKTANGVSES